jgi:hypothetical protein
MIVSVFLYEFCLCLKNGISKPGQIPNGKKRKGTIADFTAGKFDVEKSGGLSRVRDCLQTSSQAAGRLAPSCVLFHLFFLVDMI